MYKKYLYIIFAIFSVFPVFAREVTVTVEDIELNIPLEGAVIRSWDGREYICNENGEAVIQAPEDRQVVIQAAYPGYETGRIVITITGSSFFLGLRLSGYIESVELVIEASRPGTNETVTGRSIAVSGRDLTQTAEIGIIEDVINTIKLLPGVGYAGFFNAMPSIRGGEPGDLTASLDGFYIFYPYHWGGGYSIFDPRMTESAQLSHGVFSTRYGHTISGLLEVTSKKPSAVETQLELGVNTSAANFSLSIPISNKGGIMFMGRVTYYEPVVDLAKELSKSVPEIDIINYIRVPPYIRNGIITGNFRFTDNLELQATGFWGMDGIGVSFENKYDTFMLKGQTSAEFDYTNYQGFFTANLSWNPRNDMLIKFTAGTGFEEMKYEGFMDFQIHNKQFSEEFKTEYNDLFSIIFILNQSDAYYFYNIDNVKGIEFLFNLQGSINYDWKFADTMLFSAGLQEMYNRYRSSGDQTLYTDVSFSSLKEDEKQDIREYFNDLVNPAVITIPDNLRVRMPIRYPPDAENNIFTTSGYTLIEYHPGGRYKAELGLRLDHFTLLGKGFTMQSNPVLNPRLFIEINLIKNTGIIKSLDLSAGTGLFSTINDNIFFAEAKYNIGEIKPNKSWTSVLGIKFDFLESIFLNIECYYKYIFNRMYIPISIDNFDELTIRPNFDGTGHGWGFDMMLQKLQSRYWDGWLSYSFNWTKFRDPEGIRSGMGLSGGIYGDDWYYPSYHRFHNLNLVLNFKPAPGFNIYTRFGIASGIQLRRFVGDGPKSYPVLVYDNNDPDKSYFIEKFYWSSIWDENNRTTPSLPMDVKFSIFGNNKNGKVVYELYAAVENVLALLYVSQGNTSYNQYTGQIDTGSDSANYEMPIPIPSFGFKISY